MDTTLLQTLRQRIEHYLTLLSVEERDHVISTSLSPWWRCTPDGSREGPCLVMAAEPQAHWGSAPKACAAVPSTSIYTGSVPEAFDHLCMYEGIDETIEWIKAECARLNQSTEKDVQHLVQHQTAREKEKVPC